MGDRNSAVIPSGRAFVFPDRCVCCSSTPVVHRESRAATSHRIGNIDCIVDFALTGVPYCAEHAAEYDAHLAKQRKELGRKQLPVLKPLANGKPAVFFKAAGKEPGGTLGFSAHVDYDVKWEDGSKFRYWPNGGLTFIFNDPDVAAAFRETNRVVTQNEAHLEVKRQRRALADERGPIWKRAGDYLKVMLGR